MPPPRERLLRTDGARPVRVAGTRAALADPVVFERAEDWRIAAAVYEVEVGPTGGGETEGAVGVGKAGGWRVENGEGEECVGTTSKSG